MVPDEVVFELDCAYDKTGPTKNLVYASTMLPLLFSLTPEETEQVMQPLYLELA